MPRSPLRSKSARRSVAPTKVLSVPSGGFAMNRYTAGNAVTLLRSGAEYFPALLAAIEGAEREIWLETYIFAEDDTGR